MATNDFVPVATGGGANVLTQSAYLASPLLTPGQQPGIASSAFNNKALRQACFIASSLAQFMVNQTGDPALDNGNQTTMIDLIETAFKTPPTFVNLTGAGTFTVPVGATAIEVQAQAPGGGGGGSGVGGETAGGNGSNLTFGSITATGGIGGTVNQGPGGIGGSATTGGDWAGLPVTGGSGGPGAGGGGGLQIGGGDGGGCGGGGAPGSNGQNGALNTGGGGGGAGANAAGGTDSAPGGGKGGFIRAFNVGVLAATYAYSVPVSGGTPGAAGTSGFNGGQGDAGYLTLKISY